MTVSEVGGAPRLAFHTAGRDDVGPVVALVESAYRGPDSRAGWTTEADLLDGQRTDRAAVAALVADPAGCILLARDGERLLACAHLERRGERAYFGMFAVDPRSQGSGVGSRLLAEAESRAAQLWGAGTMEMTVIRQRRDLISWYERRGYRETGERRPFPYGDERFGVPRRADLEFVVLTKALP